MQDIKFGAFTKSFYCYGKCSSNHDINVIVWSVFVAVHLNNVYQNYVKKMVIKRRKLCVNHPIFILVLCILCSGFLQTADTSKEAEM